MSSKEKAMGQWQPVEYGFEYADGGDYLYVNGGDVEMNSDANEGDRWVVLPDDLRLCRFTPAVWVDWEKVPPGFDWVAADGDGRVFAYDRMPDKADSLWDARGGILLDGELPLGLDWRLSLRRRPGSEEGITGV